MTHLWASESVGKYKGKDFFLSKAFLPGVPGLSCIINKPDYSVMFTTYLMMNNRYKYCEVAQARIGHGRTSFS